MSKLLSTLLASVAAVGLSTAAVAGNDSSQNQGADQNARQTSPSGQSDSQSTDSMHREGQDAQAQGNNESAPSGQSDSQSAESMHREGQNAQAQESQSGSQDESFAQGQSSGSDDVRVEGGTAPTWEGNQAQGQQGGSQEESFAQGQATDQQDGSQMPNGPDEESVAAGKEGSTGTQSGPEPQTTPAEQAQEGDQGQDTESFAQGKDGSPGTQSGEQETQNQQSGTDGAAQNDPNMNPSTGNVAEPEDEHAGRVGRRPDQPGGAVTAEEQEMLSAMKKCESMSGDMKTQCMKDARKKAGEM